MTLKVASVSAGYGTSLAVQDVSFHVGVAEVVALIGANGAGKSTICKLTSGLIPVRSGEITFNGTAISQLSTAARIEAGIAHVPEGRQVFTGLTVEANLELGGFVMQGGAAEIRRRRDEMFEEFPLLRERMRDLAGNLSGGQQQILAIARGLMSRPKLLILDEPSLGLSPLLVSGIFEMISKLQKSGLSVLLSEQNAKMSLDIADRGYVVENGQIVLTGTGRELIDSDDVAARYLGLGDEQRQSTGDRGSRVSAQLKELITSGARHSAHQGD